MTNPRRPDPPRPSALAAGGGLLETVHWHIERGDHLRAGVASRAGTVLSTNALVVAGIALAFSARGQRPGPVLAAVAVATLACVVASVGNAALSLVSLRHWNRQFRDDVTPTALFYCQAEIEATARTFEEFRARVTAVSLEDLLESALSEWWRCARLHAYRHGRLRAAMRWLLAALVLFLAAAAVSVLR